MSLSGTIRRPDKRPLGSVEDVKRRVSDAFPGIQFVLERGEPPRMGMARKRMSLFLRLWRAAFSIRRRYAYWACHYQAHGSAVGLYFEASEPVRWIRASLDGRNVESGADGFERLCTATGWTIVLVDDEISNQRA